uniref:Uncharacterized protein n=1 Tax=uncultured prokaryote TaxID=198431 RepID=A0A0H5Q7W7_9ZZZZ|nr:hypothetical protein [uncultured prokaryote]
MRVKYEYAGSAGVEKGLLVYVNVVTGTSRRVKPIVVPWSELDDMTILGLIDKAVRKRLMAAWEVEEDVKFDLFNE